MRRGVVQRNRDYVFCLPCRLPEGASRCLATIVSTFLSIRNVQTGILFAPKPPPELWLRERKVTASVFVNEAQSNRQDTAVSPWRDGCARSEPGEAGPRRASGPTPATASRSGAGRENEKSARQVLPPIRQMAAMIGTAQPPPRRLPPWLKLRRTRRRAKHSGRIARRCLGPRLKWRDSTGGVYGARRKRHLKRGRGGDQRVPMRLRDRDETAFSNDWKICGRIFQTLEKIAGSFPIIGKVI